MHHNEGKETPIENKPIDITERKYITIYEISYKKHSNYYNFFSSDDLIEDFLTNVKLIFRPANHEVSIMCGFTIQNFQPTPTLLNLPMSNSRYWSTNVYRTVYFNDHIYSELARDIKKRVIINGLSASSCHFQKFNHLNLKVLKKSYAILKR